MVCAGEGKPAADCRELHRPAALHSQSIHQRLLHIALDSVHLILVHHSSQFRERLQLCISEPPSRYVQVLGKSVQYW